MKNVLKLKASTFQANLLEQSSSGSIKAVFRQYFWAIKEVVRQYSWAVSRQYKAVFRHYQGSIKAVLLESIYALEVFKQLI